MPSRINDLSQTADSMSTSLPSVFPKRQNATKKTGKSETTNPSKRKYQDGKAGKAVVEKSNGRVKTSQEQLGDVEEDKGTRKNQRCGKHPSAASEKQEKSLSPSERSAKGDKTITKIVVMRNGDPFTKRVMLINKNNLQSFESLLQDIGECFQLRAKRLFTEKGCKVSVLALLVFKCLSKTNSSI